MNDLSSVLPEIPEKYDLIGQIAATGPLAAALLLFIIYLVRRDNKRDKRHDNVVDKIMEDGRSTTAALVQNSGSNEAVAGALDRLTQEVRHKS